MNKKSILISIVYTLAAILCVVTLIPEFILRPERNIAEKGKIIEVMIRTVFFIIISVRFFRINTRGPRNILLFQYIPFFAGAFTKDKKSFRKLLSIGKLLNKGKFEKAYTEIELLKKKCSTAYDRTSLLLTEALCLNAKQNYDAALSVLELALFESPDFSTTQALRALLHQHFGMSAQAAETLQSLASSTRSNYVVPLCKAIFHFNRLEYTTAYACAKDALTLNKTSALSMFVAYKSNLALKQDDVAEYYLTQIKKFGSNLKDLEQYSKAFLMK